MIRPVTTGAPVAVQRIGAIGKRDFPCGTSPASSVTTQVFISDNVLMSSTYIPLSVHLVRHYRYFHLHGADICTDVDNSNHYYHRRAYKKPRAWQRSGEEGETCESVT